MKVGEALVQLLESYSVDTVFGIPGTHSIELYRGLAQSSIRHILPRHEQGAGFMADGYARVSGKPGVCIVITGPGVTNISTAMGEAYSDSVPLLVISPMNDIVRDAHGNNQNVGRLHEVANQSKLTCEFTAFSETAQRTADLPVLIARAFDVFSSGRPRPVHISIPLSILQSDIDENHLLDGRLNTSDGSLWQRPLSALPPIANDHQVQAIVAKLTAAKNPLIIAGGGCRHFGEVVINLAEKIPAPVITTVAGRGAIQGSHPLCCGMQLSSPAACELLAASDLVLVFGSELAQPDHWLDSLPLPEDQVWVNLDPDVPSALYARTEKVLCLQVDAQAALLSVSAALPQMSAESMQRVCQLVKASRDKHGDAFTAKQKRHWRVLTEVRKYSPDNLIVCSDMTQLAYTAIDYMPLQIPNTWFHPNGFGTLGYALPAGIGVKLAHEAAPVLVIVGDAGFQYTMQEMAVAAELDLNIVVLLWQNDALLQISDDMDDAGFESMAVTQANPDFQILAQGYGWNSRLIKGLSQLGPALEAAFADPSPVLLEVLEDGV